MDTKLRRRTVWLGIPALGVLALAAAGGADLAAAALGGVLLGSLACWRLLHPAREEAEREAAALRAALEEGKDAVDDATALLDTTSRLRHDLNGILSPTLLTADRLLAHEDATVRRAGEIMVKTVERASARLAETRPPTTPRKD
ncbi:MAG: hypothetical protein WDN04_21065 [Rhodospirillales bacterium]